MEESFASGKSQSLGDHREADSQRVCRLTADPTGDGRVIITCDDLRPDQTDELQDSHDQLEQMYDAAPVGMCLVDKDLRYVRVNQLLADINNASIDDHISRTV